MTVQTTTADSTDVPTTEESDDLTDAEAALNEFEDRMEDRLNCRIYRRSTGTEYLIVETSDTYDDTAMIMGSVSSRVIGDDFSFQRCYVRDSGLVKLWFEYQG